VEESRQKQADFKAKETSKVQAMSSVIRQKMEEDVPFLVGSAEFPQYQAVLDKWDKDRRNSTRPKVSPEDIAILHETQVPTGLQPWWQGLSSCARGAEEDLETSFPRPKSSWRSARGEKEETDEGKKDKEAAEVTPSMAMDARVASKSSSRPGAGDRRRFSSAVFAATDSNQWTRRPSHGAREELCVRLRSQPHPWADLTKVILAVHDELCGSSLAILAEWGCGPTSPAAETWSGDPGTALSWSGSHQAGEGEGRGGRERPVHPDEALVAPR